VVAGAASIPEFAAPPEASGREPAAKSAREVLQQGARSGGASEPLATKVRQYAMLFPVSALGVRSGKGHGMDGGGGGGESGREDPNMAEPIKNLSSSAMLPKV